MNNNNGTLLMNQVTDPSNSQIPPVTWGDSPVSDCPHLSEGVGKEPKAIYM